MDAEGLEAVIKYLYSGEAKVDYKTVIAVYDAAHRLNVPSLVQVRCSSNHTGSFMKWSGVGPSCMA